MELENASLQPANGNAIMPACVTKKKIFISEDLAVEWELHNREKYHLAAQRAYRCDSCVGWHLTAIPADAYTLAKSPIYQMSTATAQRLTGDSKSERDQTILDLFTSGKERQQIAEETGLSYQTVCRKLRSLDGQPVKRKTRTQSLPTLDGIAEEKKALLDQLKKLAQTEQQLIERKALKLLLCWEGKGVLIEKETNRLALALPDCKELVDKLTTMLGEVGG